MRSQAGSRASETARRAGAAIGAAGWCGTSLGERAVLGEGAWVLGETALEPGALQPLGAQESHPSRPRPCTAAGLVLEPSTRPCESSSQVAGLYQEKSVVIPPYQPCTTHRPILGFISVRRRLCVNSRSSVVLGYRTWSRAEAAWGGVCRPVAGNEGLLLWAGKCSSGLARATWGFLLAPVAGCQGVRRPSQGHLSSALSLALHSGTSLLNPRKA